MLRVRHISTALLLALTAGSCPTQDATSPNSPSSSPEQQATVSISLTGCPTTVVPPAGDGWISCAADITASNMSKTVTSGYIAAFMNWGCPVGTDCSSYYHGDVAVSDPKPGSAKIHVVSTYLPRAKCTATMATTVDLYDGHQNSSGAPLLYSIPVTLNINC